MNGGGAGSRRRRGMVRNRAGSVQSDGRALLAARLRTLRNLAQGIRFSLGSRRTRMAWAKSSRSSALSLRRGKPAFSPTLARAESFRKSSSARTTNFRPPSRRICTVMVVPFMNHISGGNAAVETRTRQPRVSRLGRRGLRLSFLGRCRCICRGCWIGRRG